LLVILIDNMFYLMCRLSACKCCDIELTNYQQQFRQHIIYLAYRNISCFLDYISLYLSPIVSASSKSAVIAANLLRWVGRAEAFVIVFL
jgi:hypothetical protein